MLPVCMHFENPFVNIPVQLNLPPTPTQQDSLQRLKIKIKFPNVSNGQNAKNALDNGTIKIIWSQKLENIEAENEIKRQLEEKKEQEH